MVAVAAGLGADRLVGEPPTAVHPVAWFGTAMSHVERRCYRPRVADGGAYATAGLGLGVLAGLALRRAARGTEAATLVATAVAVAGRALDEAATTVGQALAVDDLAAARAALPSLVGRDPTGLDEAGIARAVVESVAENTVDAIVAPALWAALAGAPGAFGYRAVNTMDAMVGHRTDRYRRFGTPAARLDDVANWVPARATALLVVAARPRAAGPVWRAVRRDAPAHPSPNAGVAEAAFAAALGLRLGGTNVYEGAREHRGHLGDGRDPDAGDIAAAVRLSRDCTAMLALVLLLLALPRRRRTR